MIEVVLVICVTVSFCVITICGTWIRVEQIRKQGTSFKDLKECLEKIKNERI